MTNELHIHRLAKVGPVWKCADPLCNFFVYFRQEYIIVGRACMCNECGEAFALDEDAMREDLPRCITCRHPELKQVV